MVTADVPTPPINDAREELQEAVPEAAATLRELLNAKDERVQIRAAEAILDRAGLTKAKQTSTVAAKRDIGGEEATAFLDGIEDVLR